MNAVDFVRKSCAIVNGVETLADEAWAHVNNVVNRHTVTAHQKLRTLIRRLPDHKDAALARQGHVDFQSPMGQHARAKFFHAARAVYDEWHRGIRNELDLPALTGSKPWERSLGTATGQHGVFIRRVRHSAMQKAHRLLDLHTQPLVSEAKELVSARVSGKGLPRYRGAHSRTTSIVLRGLKGVVHDQEKAMIENVLRGIDLLPRNHANKLYDAATGLALRDALNAVADEFSVGAMDKRQLKAAVKTHISAMIRRIAGSMHVPGARKWLMVEPTRRKDKRRSTRAFRVVDPEEHMRSTMGSGDSLGRHPNDRLIPVPVPEHMVHVVAKTARKLRKKRK